MSPGPLPEYVDASLAFTHGDRITASLQTGQLQRLRQYLHSESSPEESFGIELVFVRDAGGDRRVTGHFTGMVTLECQRCLGPLVRELEGDIDLLVADSEESARQLAAENEVVISTERDGHRVIELLPLVEDGLILSLPLVPKHDEGGCRMDHVNQAQEQTPASGGIARQDKNMQEQLQALRDRLAGKNKH